MKPLGGPLKWFNATHLSYGYTYVYPQLLRAFYATGPRPPRREITSKSAFTIVEQLHTKKRRRWKLIFIFLPKRRTKKRIIKFFIPFKSMCILLFLSLAFNKVFKTVSRVWFYCERLLVACFDWSFLRFLLFCVFIIKGQSSENESAARWQ